MGRYKITDEMLQDIEDYAQDQYSLDELFEELSISKRLKKDEQILRAYERGLIKNYIYLSSSGISDKEIIESYEISLSQCIQWKEQYKEDIQEAKQKKNDAEKHATKQMSNPLYSGMINILNQNPNKDIPISQQILGDDILEMVKKVKEGDTSHLITILTTNVLQLQVFNSTITNNITGEAGKQIVNFERLSNMQIKVMQETRKSIMAINEIVNPKRTTFIKEASQHNHLHQNSPKKIEKENELQNETKLIEDKTNDEVEVTTLKEKALNE